MWNLNPDERLREWKSFRCQLGSMSLAVACAKVSHLWSYAPYVNHYLDPDCSTSLVPWPDPWTLLYNNYYCDIAKCLGMLYTLYLSDHKPADIELLLGVDTKLHEPCNLVSLDNGNYILNLEFDTVVNKEQIPETFNLRHRYNATDLKLNQY
jgi:hypothetical protein